MLCPSSSTQQSPVVGCVSTQGRSIRVSMLFNTSLLATLVLWCFGAAVLPDVDLVCDRCQNVDVNVRVERRGPHQTKGMLSDQILERLANLVFLSLQHAKERRLNDLGLA